MLGSHPAGFPVESLDPIYRQYSSSALASPWTASDTISVIESLSSEYGVSSSTMKKVVTCETGNNIASTSIQSWSMWHGVEENSWGLAQIDLDYHPEISRKQAQDPIFSLSYLARSLANDQGSMWSCYRHMSL